MLKNSKIKIVSIVPRLQARLVSVMPSYSMPKLVSIKANSVGHGIKPTFTRASTAYKSDGSVVNAGVPRIEAGKGTLVEEGTTNLAGAISTFAIVGGKGLITVANYEIPYGASSVVKITKLTGTVEAYASFRKPISVTANTTYTISFKVKVLSGSFGDVGVHYTGNSYSNAQKFLISDGWYQYYYTGPVSTTTLNAGVAFFGTAAGEYLIADLQLEAKPYATTFHPSIRTAESLTVPASALSAVEGTIEFDVEFNMDTYLGSTLGYRYVLDIGSSDANTRLIIYTHPSYGKIYLQVGMGAIYEGVATDFIPTKGVKYRFAMSYKDKVSIWINGVKKGTSVNNHALNVTRNGYIGSHFSNFVNSQANSYFSNLRISNKARTDVELANTGALTVDEYTTYFAELTTDLTAYTKGNGNATLKSISC